MEIQMIKMQVNSFSPEDTKMLGLALGGILQNQSTVILLTGDLGAGKTALSKAIVKGYGIDELVTSPTYTLVNVYQQDSKKIYHFDLYRLESPDELYEIGFEEFVEEGCPMIIEWPQILDEFELPSVLNLEIKIQNEENSRVIFLETQDENLQKELERFDQE